MFKKLEINFGEGLYLKAGAFWSPLMIRRLLDSQLNINFMIPSVPVTSFQIALEKRFYNVLHLYSLRSRELRFTYHIVNLITDGFVNVHLCPNEDDQPAPEIQRRTFQNLMKEVFRRRFSSDWYPFQSGQIMRQMIRYLDGLSMSFSVFERMYKHVIYAFQLLIVAGIPIHGKQGKHPKPLLATAIQCENPFYIEMIIQLGGNLLQNFGLYPSLDMERLLIFDAISHGLMNREKMDVVLAHINVNTTDSFGNTMLSVAVRHNQVDLAHYLLENGANCRVFFADPETKLPRRNLLEEAVNRANFEMAMLLISKGLTFSVYQYAVQYVNNAKFNIVKQVMLSENPVAESKRVIRLAREINERRMLRAHRTVILPIE